MVEDKSELQFLKNIHQSSRELRNLFTDRLTDNSDRIYTSLLRNLWLYIDDDRLANSYSRLFSSTSNKMTEQPSSTKNESSADEATDKPKDQEKKNE